MIRQRCVACCPTCGRHFASDTAHRIHRVGRFDDPADPRRCESPHDIVDRRRQPRLEARTFTGRCDLGQDVQEGLTIWGLAGGRERLTEVFT